MEAPVRFRWVLLLALGFWLFAAVAYAAGWTEPGVFTFRHTFFVPVFVLVSMWPMSVARCVRSRWFLPAMGAWLAVSVPALMIGNAWLFGVGQRCIRVSVIAGLAGFVAFNVLWYREQRRADPAGASVSGNPTSRNDGPARTPEPLSSASTVR